MRRDKNFVAADLIRQVIEHKDYTVTDSSQGINVKKKVHLSLNKPSTTAPGKIALFGSGEMSPTGRRIHEYLIRDLAPPVKIALLETPAGYEDNPHQWYKKLAAMLTVGLQNFKPEIIRIAALRKDGKFSTNTKGLVKPLLSADYIHTGAGSPSYVIKHLGNSLAYYYLVKCHHQGIPLSFASAAAIAMSSFALPVYEMYFVGEDPFWQTGLNFFKTWDLNLVIIPHWNNTEGGAEIDTSRCYVGKKRFKKLLGKLQPNQTIIGIDEQTAAVFDFAKQEIAVMGVGAVTLIKGNVKQVILSGAVVGMAELK